MPTFSVTIDRTDMDLEPLVLHGSTQPGWCTKEGWTVPDFVPIVSASTSRFLHGSLETDWRYQDAILSGDVFPVVDDAPALTVAREELRAALGRLSFLVTTEENGEELTWRARAGSMTRSPLTYVHLRRHRPIWTLSMTVYPIPGVS